MPQSNYKRIGPIASAMQILKYLSNSREPVQGNTIATALEMKQPTVMTHLATLQDQLFVEETGRGYVIGQGAALLWARRKAYLDTSVERMITQRDELG